MASVQWGGERWRKREDGKIGREEEGREVGWKSGRSGRGLEGGVWGGWVRGLSESQITRITQISRIRIRLVTRLVGLKGKGSLWELYRAGLGE